ncbi:Tnf receptor-associated factor-like [Tropilaelaps mercedesae]|uniref:Tnf receptor-associated factor-like n=1 Tax=Tropilaelaps mercedesae TaxID=418985 RepID=A0A1V9Y014_9ACAR|nr:Tnf receptor-associated factor-like [Tropilaelaps mercedesae]
MQAVLIRGLPATALEARHVDLLDPPLELLCQLCYSLVPELLELSCGHVMCRWCCQSEAEVPRFFECPIDNNELVLDEKGTRFRSRLVRKDLATLMGCQAACLNRAHGCPMQGTLQEMVDHLDKCDFDRIECRRCHRFLPRIDLATHVSGHCHGARFLPSMVCLESADLWRLGLSLQDTVAETTEKQLALYMRPIQQMLEQLLKNDGGAHSNGGFHTNQQSPPPGRTLKAALGRFTERTVGNPTGSLSSCAHPIAPVDANMVRGTSTDRY